jgi:hypothetical protein
LDFSQLLDHLGRVSFPLKSAHRGFQEMNRQPSEKRHGLLLAVKIHVGITFRPNDWNEQISRIILWERLSSRDRAWRGRHSQRDFHVRGQRISAMSVWHHHQAGKGRGFKESFVYNSLRDRHEEGRRGGVKSRNLCATRLDDR